MNPTAPSPALQLNPFHRLGFFLLLCYIFILYGRIFDYALWYLHIPLIIRALLVAAVLFDGGIPRAFSSRLGLVLAGFTAWLCVALPFSAWRRLSLELLVKDWLQALFTFAVIAGLAVSFADLRKVLRIMAYGILCLSLISVVIGRTIVGRLVGVGMFGDSNDLAQVILMGLPIWLYVATTSRSLLEKLLAAAAMSVEMFALLRTGSRGTMLGLALVLTILFWRSTFVGKAKLVVCGVLAAVIAVLIMPDIVQERYLTLFRRSGPAETVEEFHAEQAAIGSAYARLDALKTSLKLTGSNPLVGVGLGMYRDVANSPIVTHNTYTEISSETGIPALILYLAGIVICWRTLSGTWKQALRLGTSEGAEIANAALCLKLMLAGYVVCAFFASLALQPQFATIAGLVLVLERSFRAAAAPVAAAQPRPAPPARRRQPALAGAHLAPGRGI